jgi:hypothetical protein
MTAMVRLGGPASTIDEHLAGATKQHCALYLFSNVTVDRFAEALAGFDLIPALCRACRGDRPYDVVLGRRGLVLQNSAVA